MATEKPVLLSVDNNQDVLEALEKTLSKLDIEVLTATSGKAGLEVLQTRQVDVVISDMNMPEMSGPEFLKQASALQPHSCRIVLTEDADPEDAKSAINDGGVSLYLDIPWKDNDLRRVIGDAVKMAKLSRQNEELQDLTQSQNGELQTQNEELEERVAQRMQELEHANGMLTDALSELEDTHERMVDLVANIAALPYPESDKARSRLRLALAIGTELDLDEEDLQHLKYAARLSKIGWVGVPRKITRKPFASMSVEERVVFEKHPSYAEAVLLSVPRLKQASKIIGYQQEKYNGHGFPQKSAGEGIPLGARILAVARDYYDLMAGVIEKEELTPAEAVAVIVADAGAAYDPDIVKIFQDVVSTIDEFDPSVEEISIRSTSLLPDMRMARDLTTDEGVVLLSKGSIFTEDTIASLVNLERRSDKELQIFVLKEDA